MEPARRVHPLWGVLFVLCLVFGWVFVGQRALIGLYRQHLGAQQARIEAQLREMEKLRAEMATLAATLRATQERLSQYEAYFERIRPIAAGVGAQISADPWAVAAQIDSSSRRYGVDPMLIVAVGHAESGWDVQAVGPMGEVGPMQVMPATFRALGGRNLWNWRENIDVGTRYLAMMLQQAGGDVRLAVAYYNAGPSRPASTVRQIAVRHVEKVMRFRAGLVFDVPQS